MNIEVAEGIIVYIHPYIFILTHMGNEMDWATLRRDLPPGVEPAFDGMVLTFS